MNYCFLLPYSNTNVTNIMLCNITVFLLKLRLTIQYYNAAKKRPHAMHHLVLHWWAAAQVVAELQYQILEAKSLCYTTQCNSHTTITIR